MTKSQATKGGLMAAKPLNFIPCPFQSGVCPLVVNRIGLLLLRLSLLYWWQSMISSSTFRCFCLFAATAAIHSNVNGQGHDPFADQDPFSKRNRSQRVVKPINITFRVTDKDGFPVPEARIRGPGIFPALFTQQRGTAIWRTDENRLRDWAARSGGKLRFHSIPPKDAVMPSVSELISLSDLLESKTLEFKTRPGVRLMGRVIGHRDRKPIKGVTVVLRPKSGSMDAPKLHARTDEYGEWNIVTPRVDAKITLRGHIDGYQLQDLPDPEINYARIVEIPVDVAEIPALDFEVKQLQPLQILVTDTSGQPVPDARARAYRQHWLDDQIVEWDSISLDQETGSQGDCSLYLRELDWRVAIVSASAVVDDANVEGRAIVPSITTDSIRVVVEPYSKIGGVLRKDGNPAANVNLVLYEAINKKEGEWTTIGIRGDTTTNDRGHYVFEAPIGLHYIVATRDRDQDGVQSIVHQTARPITSENYRVPNVDLSALQRP